MRFFYLSFTFAALAALTGCHSAIVAATIVNRTREPLSLIELDYPSASFGTESLAPGQAFHYRLQVIGDGATTLLWTDASRHNHKSAGPALREGDQGSLDIVFDSDASPTWNLHLSNRDGGT